MNKLNSVEIKRKHTSSKRISPTRADFYNLIIHYDGSQQWVPQLKHKEKSEPPVPKNIHIYVAERQQSQSHNESVTVAQWNISSWLKYALKQWADEEVNVKFVSFDYALIKTNLLSKLDVLKSNPHKWQVGLISDGKELANTSLIDELLKAPIDCMEICLGETEANEINHRTFEAIKNLVDLRELRRQNLPTIICKCTIDDTEMEENLKKWAKQARLDEIIIRNKQSEERELWDL